MPKRTVYVGDDEEELWERAKELSQGNISALLSALLQDYVTKKEAESMYTMTKQHGPVTKRLLYVWAARDDFRRSEWGTSFETGGIGLPRARALMDQMMADPEVRRVELEERRVYRDKWVDREPLERWTRGDDGWNSVR